MALPTPIPDNPRRWEGWRNYNSPNLYERLCLSYEENPSAEAIDGNCRELLVWWQKKLPLKNQPSNPITQMLRAALDEAPHFLVEAKTLLLDPTTRAQVDEKLQEGVRERSMAEFAKFFEFATAAGVLRETDEKHLYNVGTAAGLNQEEMRAAVDVALADRGINRLSKDEEEKTHVASAAKLNPALAMGGSGGTPSDEFRRVLRMSGLDEDEMTDDQRDALCNIGENLGLTGGQAEDLIDDYLEEVSGTIMPAVGAARDAAAAIRTPTVAAAPRPATAPKSAEPRIKSEPKLNVSPLTQGMERRNNPNYVTIAGSEMRLIPSGYFRLGSQDSIAAPTEQPVATVGVSCLYMSRFPITNAQFEQYDPSHKNKRAPWADDNHPVVYVSSREAEKYCLWLSARERKRYRLPTEAEWEYAARGPESRIFPWGEALIRGDVANFADARTQFAWRDPSIDDGYAQSSPVGAYPRGSSPFGIEDMAGNVHEWCLDYYMDYTSRERINPVGAKSGMKRMYRGGSWKSRASSLRASARAFNQPDYSSNDVGFRIVCEVDPVTP